MNLSRNEILFRIKNSCLKSGRRAEDVCLVAVSKLQSLEAITALYQQGQRDFGENYVQEWSKKADHFEKTHNISWHFVGHLQRNKVRQVVGRVQLIHSVDSLPLAAEISHRASLRGERQKILLQVNVSSESSKEGISPDQLKPLLDQILPLQGISLCGLMTMPPLTDDPESNRKHFSQLRELLNLNKFVRAEEHPWNQLSMGTSHDFEVAIEEGSTLIRIGTAIFGERPKKEKSL
ncbi:MAG: YggS family pyridoxal phosphate-dependent enzyme [Bdellovibrionaceae bacterium]|nr:YggS family pyridoxal phosphate-dependent enzyme [Pseudobdellovibrionaceae bacterium]